VKILKDKAIESIWDKFEIQRFEHPDADKPDFVLFDPVEYGKLVAQAQLDADMKAQEEL